MANSMLQTNYDGEYPQLFLFNQTFNADQPTPGLPPEPVSAPCAESQRLMELFEEVTGWVIGFTESNSSQQRRKLAGMENEPAEGSFSIVDMSAAWPPEKPTCHRAKCDSFVSILDSVFGQLQATRVELNRMRSVVAAVAPQNIEDDDVVLIDSFIPKVGNSRRTDNDFELHELPVQAAAADEFETEYDVFDGVSEASGELVNPPFEGWSTGGAIGIHENIYLDWQVDSQEQISVSVGKIESSFGDGDAAVTISVDPLTCEYRVSGSAELKAFFVWDSKSMSLSPLAPQAQWRRLLPGQSIVATTSPKLAQLESIGARDEDRIDHPEYLKSKDSLARADADQLAACITRQLDPSERVLVLMHS
jgi:hypothetical protein